MPRRKKESIEDLDSKIAEVLTPEGVPGLVTNSTGFKNEFVVTNSSGGEVRTYTVEIHGENAEDLAKQFAAKIGGSVK